MFKQLAQFHFRFLSGMMCNNDDEKGDPLPLFFSDEAV